MLKMIVKFGKKNRLMTLMKACDGSNDIFRIAAGHFWGGGGEFQAKGRREMAVGQIPLSL